MIDQSDASVIYSYPDGSPKAVLRKELVPHLMDGYRIEPPTITPDPTYPGPSHSATIQWPGEPFS